MRLSVAQFLEVPVENRLVRATHSTAASVKSVLEKRSVNIDQAIAARRSQLPTAVGTMGMTKMWDSSGVRPYILHTRFCKAERGHTQNGVRPCILHRLNGFRPSILHA